MLCLKRRLKLLAHNVCQWRVRSRDLCNLYREEDPDIILLSETGMNDENRIKIFGYHTLQKNSTSEVYDGVAIAIKNGIRYKEGTEMDESYLSVVIQTEMGETLIAVGYQPPRRNYLPMHNFISLFNRNIPVILMGDLNARCAASEYTTSFNKIGNNLTSLLARGVLRRIGPDFPTFLTRSSATKPDIILINRLQPYNYHVRPGPLTSSDHLPMIMDLSLSPIQIPIVPRKSFRKADWHAYKFLLSQHEVGNLEGSTLEELNSKLEGITEAIKVADSICIPTISYRTLPHPDIPRQIKERQEEFSGILRLLQVGGPDQALYVRSKRLQAEINFQLHRLQCDNWNDIISKMNIETDPKIFWDSVKRLRGTQTRSRTYVLEGDNKLYDAILKEEAFRKHWSKVYSITDEENEDFDEVHEEGIRERMGPIIDRTRPYHTVDSGRFSNDGYGSRITMEEFITALRSFKQKAPGFSGISKIHIARAPDVFLACILDVLNAAFSAGYFPHSFKTAKLIFIPKLGGSLHNVANYRPISLLEFLGKLFEKILNNRFYTFLEENERLNEFQHGFRRRRGTETALALVYEKIAWAKSGNMMVDLVLRDVKGAFDKVWTLGLQFKILNLGMAPLMERSLCDYLMDRRASICLDGFTGPPFELRAGVPQGGCLSPNLYTLYVSDVPPPNNPVNNMNIAYADDISQVVTYKTKSAQWLANITSREIENINDYERKNKIRTNMIKFAVLPIGRRKLGNVTVDGDHYEYQVGGRVLGLKVSTQGFIPHITDRIQKAKAAMGRLYRFRNLNKKNRKKLYMALVRPLLLYPAVPMHLASDSQMKRLQKVQNAGIRFVTGTSLRERRRMSELHLAEAIEPINTTLQGRARRLWERMRETMPPDVLRLIDLNEGEEWRTGMWRSSQIDSTVERLPIYV